MTPERNHREVPPTAGLPLRQSDLLGGSHDLEGALAAYLRLPSVQLECSGTAALVVILHALRHIAPKRDEVVLPAYTCPLVAWAVVRCGLKVRLSLRIDDAGLTVGQMTTLLLLVNALQAWSRRRLGHV